MKPSQMLYVACMAAVVIEFLVLVILAVTGFEHPLAEDDPLRFTMPLVLGVMAVADALLGAYLARYVLRTSLSGGYDQRQALTSAMIVRAAFFQSVAIFGLVLGILGVNIVFTLPFFVVSFLLLYYSFPTQERVNRMVEGAS